MTTMRLAVLTTLLAIGGLWFGTARLSANGQEFFPAGKGPVDLVYFGIVKDARTGRPVRDFAYITIRDRVTGMSIPFAGDKPGHYRTPDIGAVIKELGETVDPQQLDFTLFVPGYKKVKLEKLPRQSKGAIEVSFKMEPEGSQAGASATPGQSVAISANGGGGFAGPSIPIAIFVIGVVLAAIVGVGRTLVRPATTTG